MGPMYSYHYWKCYSTVEGSRKITIFTKDVDYYVWGTCYGLGDHLQNAGSTFDARLQKYSGRLRRVGVGPVVLRRQLHAVHGHQRRPPGGLKGNRELTCYRT